MHELPGHADRNFCFGFSYRVIAHPIFSIVTILMIMANIIVLSLDKVDLTEEEEY
jgi:hypothetical protein